MVRIAAAGDVHASRETEERVESAFAGLDAGTNLVLLAGDLTLTGDPGEAEVLATAARSAPAPVFAVLGNHDYHAGRADEVAAVLEESGIRVLERSSCACRIDGLTVGIVGAKGFVGGFPGCALPDFGEPLLREVYAETTKDVTALGEGLLRIAHCDVRVVLLHYAPIQETLAGEPEGIHIVLGNDRIARPIAEHGADLVLHGHAHAGSFEGRIGEIPVYNVALHVIGRDFWLFDVEGAPRSQTTAVDEGYPR
jgi:Icc-related predicted phosphoesterase